MFKHLQMVMHRILESMFFYIHLISHNSCSLNSQTQRPFKECILQTKSNAQERNKCVQFVIRNDKITLNLTHETAKCLDFIKWTCIYMEPQRFFISQSLTCSLSYQTTSISYMMYECFRLIISMRNFHLPTIFKLLQSICVLEIIQTNFVKVNFSFETINNLQKSGSVIFRNGNNSKKQFHTCQKIFWTHFNIIF